MVRSKIIDDPFGAIAEPKRRALIEMLAGREMTVGQLVDQMKCSQSAVSKHLGVLKRVGLVSERKNGRFRVYRVEARQLEPVKEWVTQFDRYWNNSLDNLGEYLEEIQTREVENE